MNIIIRQNCDYHSAWTHRHYRAGVWAPHYLLRRDQRLQQLYISWILKPGLISYQSIIHPTSRRLRSIATAAGSSTLNCCLDFSQRYCSVCCHPHETQDSILKNLINICSFITVANLFKIENLVYTFQIRKWALVPASRPPSSWRECT